LVVAATAGDDRITPTRSAMSPVNGRPDWTMTSAAINARVSRVNVARTSCTTLRSTTMAATPRPTQRKKKIRRSQDARISRHAMRSTKGVCARALTAVAPAARRAGHP
jgi:hypothetical protein